MPLRLQLRPYALPLKHAWQSAAGGFGERRGVIVSIRDGDGRCGCGDCAPLPDMGSETLAVALAALARALPQLRELDAETALQLLPLHAADTPAARCGLETALLDLLARQRDMPLSRWLDANAAKAVKVNAIAGVLDADSASRIAATSGFTVFKFKLGLAPLRQDIERLQRLAAALPDGVQLRLDANRAWTPEQAATLVDSCAGLPVESLEEPLAQPTLEELHRLQARAAFPLALDESLPHLGLPEILSAAPVRRLVLKAGLLGGPMAALAIARKAGKAGLQCVVTTAVDSAVGTRAAVHLAAAVEANDGGLAHGLATSAWLMQDVAEPPLIDAGTIRPGSEAGLGIRSLQL